MSSPSVPPTVAVPGARIVALAFALAISVPGAGLALGYGRSVASDSEMRLLAEWPGVPRTRVEAAAWPAEFRTYFNDHFALRAELIDWRSSLLWRWFGTSPFDTVIAGKDGWLFFADDGGLRDWIQAEPFTASELADWREALLRRRAFLAARGIPYVFAVAPDKHMVYPEFMPDSLRRLRDDFRADQLIAYMKATAPDVEILDLRPSLVDGKSGELLYHRYDTHWNDRGALIGYQQIARTLEKWFPAPRMLTRADFDTDASVPSGDRASMLGLVDTGKQAMPGLVLRRGQGYRIVAPARPDPFGEDPILIVEHRDRTLPTALVLRDSFGARLLPYLSEHFSRVEYYWTNELPFDEIERLKPDVVVQEFVARHFYTFGPYPPDIPK